jgi:hypothetical protein
MEGVKQQATTTHVNKLMGVYYSHSIFMQCKLTSLVGVNCQEDNTYDYPCFFVFFFCSNLLGRWVGNHPQEDVAKLSYTSERKIKKRFRNHVIFWQHPTTYCLNQATSIFSPHNVMTMGHVCPHNNVTTMGHFFRQ